MCQKNNAYIYRPLPYTHRRDSENKRKWPIPNTEQECLRTCSRETCLQNKPAETNKDKGEKLLFIIIIIRKRIGLLKIWRSL
jgi:hypothetical protein